MKTRVSLAVLVAILAARAEAQDPRQRPDSSQERAPRWGLTTTLGFGGSGGDFGDLLTKPQSGDYSIFRNNGAWRYGLGISFGSFVMKEPYQDEKEWGFQETYLFATRMLKSEGSVRPYIQVRGGLARLHPRSELFKFSPPPESPGDSPTHPTNGFSFGVVPGVEFRLNRSLALDVSGLFDYFHVSEYDLSPVGLAPKSSGTKYEARFGLRWHPDDGWPSGPPGPDAPARQRDAWGVSKNLGWAIGEDLAINWIASGVNEYVRNANFNQISPRSWWSNLKAGLNYDDNDFKTNQLIHPFNGTTYYNSGRANGFGYWESSAFALGGAFFWECCGETHPMAFNDLVSTTMGGIAWGEVGYRLSSEILDNRATGPGRFFKELAGFVVDPVRGLNRAVSGRWGAQHDNPSDPLDWRPPEKLVYLTSGVRIVGQGHSISHNTDTHPYISLDHDFGSVFDNERRKPFDSFDADVQLSFGDAHPLTEWMIRGDLWSKPLGESKKYALSITQHFDYQNNLAYQFGNQAVGPSLYARYKLAEHTTLRFRVDGLAVVSLLSAVNADYSFLANVPNREEFRKYDYGPGLGAQAEAHLTHRGQPLVFAQYRFHWVSVTNGSIFEKGDIVNGNVVNEEGSSANHYLQQFELRLFAPIHKGIGVGADTFEFLRKSRYESPLLIDHDQRHPEVRLYLAWAI
jgi:hypothetical protein